MSSTAHSGVHHRLHLPTMKVSSSVVTAAEFVCGKNHGKRSRKRMLPVSEASFACYVKACAPPPAGKGGSSKAGVQARRLAEGIVAKAASAEKEVTGSLRSLVGEAGGTLVGLKHRVKGIGSLTRKIHDKAAQRGQTLEESAGKISDALRYTVALHSGNYSAGIKNTLNALKKAGYKVDEKETYWKRGDDYNGVHAIVRHPNGTKVEIQFHTTASLAAKKKTHAIYETVRRPDIDPAEKSRLMQEMVKIADAAKVPFGARWIGKRKFKG